MSISVVRQLACVRRLSNSKAADTKSSRGRNIQLRSVHTSSVQKSWVQKMRPDLAELHPLAKPKDDPTWKEEQLQLLMWYKQASTDVMAKRISKHLLKGGSVRVGIVRILLERAHKPEHIRAALQGYSWLQVKYNSEMERKDVVLLVQACVRARAPEIAIEVLASMNWLRLWPTTKEMNVLLNYFASNAHRLALRNPTQREAPEFDTEHVEPAPNALPTEEEAEEEEAAEAKEDKETPDQKLDKHWKALLGILADPRFELKMDFKMHRNVMRYWAARGSVEKASRAWAEMSKLNSAAADTYLESIAFAYLAHGDLKRAVRQFEQSPPKSPSKPSSDDSFYMARQARIVKLMLAVAQHDVQKAVAALKEAKHPYVESYVATHLGHLDRFATLKEAFKALEEGGVAPPEGFADYLGKVEAHLQEIAPKEEKKEEEKKEN